MALLVIFHVQVIFFLACLLVALCSLSGGLVSSDVKKQKASSTNNRARNPKE
jgi:hypothetical protein